MTPRSPSSARSVNRNPVSGANRKSVSEKKLALGIMAGVAGIISVIAVTGASASIAVGESQEKMNGTFGRAALAQMEFRARYDRFAVWEELREQGMLLPEPFSVVRSNAGSSHWYLKLRDRSTGLVCDRVGELLEGPESATPPSCERIKD